MLPLAFQWAPPLFLGATVVGDSPQFSALAARHASAEDVGSVLMVPIAFALTIVSIAITNWMLQHVPVQWLFMPVAIRQAIVLIASGECSGRRTAERKCRAERAPCAQAHIIARSNGRSSFFSSVSCDGGCASFSGFSG